MKSKIKQFLSPLVKRAIPGTFDENRNDRTGMLFKAWGHVITNQMRGRYYEFGVYKGDSFRESYRIYQNFVLWMKSQATSPELWRRKIKWHTDHNFYGFDTFEGMPDNDENNETFAKGTFLSNLDDVKRLGENIGMKEGKNIKYFKGEFAKIALSKVKEIKDLQPAVIVNIDSDLYASAKDVLGIIEPKLQQGTILLMDDWNCFCASNSHGERRALAEFLKENVRYEVEDYCRYSHAGRAFIVHIKTTI